jgi:hypothetical protein
MGMLCAVLRHGVHHGFCDDKAFFDSANFLKNPENDPFGVDLYFSILENLL